MMSPHYNRNIFPPNPHYFQSLKGDFCGSGTTENSKSLTIAVTRLPLKASECYANYLFKFPQIETLILVKIPPQMN